MEKGKNIDTKSLQNGRKTFTQAPTILFLGFTRGS